jgi:hypothetical protein
MSNTQLRKIKIFISSPTDVMAERDRAAHVIIGCKVGFGNV